MDAVAIDRHASRGVGRAAASVDATARSTDARRAGGGRGVHGHSVVDPDGRVRVVGCAQRYADGRVIDVERLRVGTDNPRGVGRADRERERARAARCSRRCRRWRLRSASRSGQGTAAIATCLGQPTVPAVRAVPTIACMLQTPDGSDGGECERPRIARRVPDPFTRPVLAPEISGPHRGKCRSFALCRRQHDRAERHLPGAAARRRAVHRGRPSTGSQTGIAQACAAVPRGVAAEVERVLSPSGPEVDDAPDGRRARDRDPGRRVDLRPHLLARRC